MDKEKVLNEKELVQFLMGLNPEFKGAKSVSVKPMEGDASGRRYLRVELKNAPMASAILLYLNGGKGPVVGGGNGATQDDTFVELGDFFHRRGIPVPRIYSDGRKHSVLLLEDVGDAPLWRFAFEDYNKDAENILVNMGGDTTFLLYSRAIQVIKQLQELEPEDNIVGFTRHLNFEHLHADAVEFVDHYCTPDGLGKASIEQIKNFLKVLVETVRDHPKALSHRDFTSWNLHVGTKGEIRVIDYQDAFWGDRFRDLVSLLNDRGVDKALGKTTYLRLLDEGIKILSNNKHPMLSYGESLLYWDFRVIGRFNKLVREKDMPKYKQWIPGTLIRLGRTINSMQGKMHLVDDIAEILSSFSPEFKDGLTDPWVSI